MRAFLLSLISFVLIGGCNPFDPLNYDKEKGAPDVAIEKRHAWGKRRLGIPYQRIVNWLKNAEVVKENRGDVITIAPIRRPNFIRSYFLDDPNLDVFSAPELERLLILSALYNYFIENNSETAIVI